MRFKKKLYAVTTVEGLIISLEKCVFFSPGTGLGLLDCSEDTNASQISFWVLIFELKVF